MYHNYSITNKAICQELIQSNTLASFSKHIEFRNKYENLILPNLNERQRALWQQCSTDLWVRDDGTVAAVNSCKNRFCAVCNWRNARKRFGLTMQAVEQLEKETAHQYLLFTVTVQNCKDYELQTTLDKMMSAVNRMQSTNTWRNRVEGYIRGLEVTYNNKKDSEWFNTYHPHIHYILVLPEGYYTNPELYLQTGQWRELWERSAKLNYIAQIDIKPIKALQGDLAGAVAEVSKYAVKMAEIVREGRKTPTRVIMESIAGRRLTAFGGCMRIVKKMIQDAEKSEKSKGYIIEGHRFTRIGTSYEYAEEIHIERKPTIPDKIAQKIKEKHRRDSQETGRKQLKSLYSDKCKLSSEWWNEFQDMVEYENIYTGDAKDKNDYSLYRRRKLLHEIDKNENVKKEGAQT